MLDMLEYYKMIKECNINIIYSGPVWPDGIEGLGGTLRKRMEFDDMPLPASQSVFSVFIEQMNNVLMYSAEKESFEIMDNKRLDVPKGIFVLGARDRIYFIQSGNIIKNENAEILKSRIDYLNTLDKPALRKYFKEQIKIENANSESKGAGLGLIEIARRASAPIEYSFSPLENGMSFFSMSVTIGGSV